jgi:hypothetical protein
MVAVAANSLEAVAGSILPGPMMLVQGLWAKEELADQLAATALVVAAVAATMEVAVATFLPEVVDPAISAPPEAPIPALVQLFRPVMVKSPLLGKKTIVLTLPILKSRLGGTFCFWTNCKVLAEQYF